MEAQKRSLLSLTIVLAVIGLLVASIATPNLLRSRIAANEASAVGSLRSINTAVATYRAQHPGEGYPRQLSDLSPYLDPTLAAGVKSGYQFRYEPGGMNPDGSAARFKVVASPAVEGQSGQRTFSTSDSGGINYRASRVDSEKPLDGGGAPAQSTSPSSGQESRRMMRRATLALVVGDPDVVADKIRSVANRLGGYVESARFSGESAGARQGSLAIRVPVVRLDEARRDVRALAQRVTSEEDDARDVTAQYVDLESTLRNYRAEEAQYLEIMRRAGSIKDTLAVAERLADARGRIERAQGQLNLMSRQTEMAALEVTLTTEVIVKPVDVRWHPSAEIAAAFGDALSDLSTFANFLIAVAFRLPVLALWALTLLAAAVYGWRLLRWTWRKMAPRPAAA